MQLRFEPPDPWDTMVYTKPAPVTRLRLVIEEAAILAIAFTGYLIWDPPPSNPAVPPRNIWQKLTLAPQSWYFDSDSITTNFVGHPTAGTFYYMFARANRVPLWEAALWGTGMALAWELIEFKEPGAINDVISTSVGGVAIGEGFVQLSAWFDRSGDSPFYKAMAFIFDPMKKIHDWMDGVHPDRNPAHRGWHRFRVAGSGLVLRQAGVEYVGAGVGISTQIVHLPDYGSEGHGSYGFADGNVSAMELSSTIAASRTVDFLYETETGLVGSYSRALEKDGDELHGWDLLASGTVAYEFSSHDWNIAANAPSNQIALVRFPGADVRVRAFAGDLELDCALDAAFDFGGVEPLGMPSPTALPPGTSFPTVYSIQRYYFGIGVHVAPSMEIRYGHVALGGSWRSDWLWGITGPFIPQPSGEVVVMSDSRSTGRAWLAARFLEPGVEIALTGTLRGRRGEAGNSVTSASETSLAASLGVVF
jgi:hypothetical protein